MSVVVVTGGRHYPHRSLVFEALDILHALKPITLLVHGACKYGGADIHGESWAKAREITYVGMPARFTTEGRPGGMRRNARMIAFAIWIADCAKDPPPRVCFFPGGVGTQGCIGIAERHSLELIDGERIALTKQPDGAA